MSPPKDVLQRLARMTDIFVETGAYHGETSLLALECGFREVYTIEIYQPAYEIACERCQGFPVDLRFGDSGELLAVILKELTRVAVIFLDAHFVSELADSTGIGQEPAPLRRELTAIAASPHRHIVCIDDADYLGSETLSQVTFEEVQDYLPGYIFEIVDGVRAKSLLIATP